RSTSRSGRRSRISPWPPCAWAPPRSAGSARGPRFPLRLSSSKESNVMAGYTRAEARDWARERLIGAVNCTIPSFTGDLGGINEAAIRHDVRLAKSHGFIGTLGVSEVSITLPECLEFLALCKDEAGPGFYVVHHASWSNLEQNLAAVTGAERAGADL